MTNVLIAVDQHQGESPAVEPDKEWVSVRDYPEWDEQIEREDIDRLLFFDAAWGDWGTTDGEASSST